MRILPLLFHRIIISFKILLQRFFDGFVWKWIDCFIVNVTARVMNAAEILIGPILQPSYQFRKGEVVKYNWPPKNLWNILKRVRLWPTRLNRILSWNYSKQNWPFKFYLKTDLSAEYKPAQQNSDQQSIKTKWKSQIKSNHS